MLRSIRWSLQLWHAILLLAVVSVFGAILYLRVRQARLENVDAELRAEAEVLAARIRPPPPIRPRRDGPEPWPDRGGEGPIRGRSAVPMDPLPGREPGRRLPPPAWEPLAMMEADRRPEVPDFVWRRFEAETPDGLYFAIFPPNSPAIQSRPALNVPAPAFEWAPAAAPRFRQRGELREAIVTAPFGTQVVVGRCVAREYGELRQLAGLLVATGLLVTAVGLAGGWLLAGRAIAPIRAITATAQSISASNLSRRISIAQTKSELGDLAGVLNDMFARLEAAFERQVRFTADASHELRTPLSIVYSQAELALARERPAEEYRQSIETCFRAAQRMKSLVESLLVLARADAGRLQLRSDDFDLADSARECVELVGQLAAARRVELKMELASTPVRGDSFRMAQVITNLLTNAIHYNREGGSVTVSVGPRDNRATLSVSDTGVGIAPEDQAHLFERFYRVDKARSRELGGSGLGLAICRSIVEAHGGMITCVSAPGEGSTFTVQLPLAPPRGDDVPARPAAAMRGAASA